MLEPGSCFGAEEMLCHSRRPFTATVTDHTAVLLRLPVAEYRKVWWERWLQGCMRGCGRGACRVRVGRVRA